MTATKSSRIVTQTSRKPEIVLPKLIEIHAADLPRYRELLEAAKLASGNAYCPYSNYNVGAAALTFDGRIYTGCNIESCAYTQTKHAEEIAIGAAVAGGLLKRATDEGLTQFQAFLAVAVYAPKGSDPWPCSNCRQSLSEFGYDTHIIGEDQAGKTDKILCLTLAQLVPHPFPIEEVLKSVRGET